MLIVPIGISISLPDCVLNFACAKRGCGIFVVGFLEQILMFSSEAFQKFKFLAALNLIKFVISNCFPLLGDVILSNGPDAIFCLSSNSIRFLTLEL